MSLLYGKARQRKQSGGRDDRVLLLFLPFANFRYGVVTSSSSTNSGEWSSGRVVVTCSKFGITAADIFHKHAEWRYCGLGLFRLVGTAGYVSYIETINSYHKAKRN